MINVTVVSTIGGRHRLKSSLFPDRVQVFEINDTSAFIFLDDMEFELDAAWNKVCQLISQGKLPHCNALIKVGCIHMFCISKYYNLKKKHVSSEIILLRVSTKIYDYKIKLMPL